MQAPTEAHLRLQPKLREVQLPRLQRATEGCQLLLELRAVRQRCQRLGRALAVWKVGRQPLQHLKERDRARHA